MTSNEDFLSPDFQRPAISPRVLMPTEDTPCHTIQGVSISTVEVVLEYEHCDALMGWHDNQGRLASTLIGVTCPVPYGTFYLAIVEAGFTRTLHFPDGGTVRAGYEAPWGYLLPELLVDDDLLRARHTRAAMRAGWQRGIDRDGEPWRIDA